MGRPATFQVQFVTPSPTVEVHLPDGKSICAPRGTPVGEFLKLVQSESPDPIVGAVVNNELR